MASTLIATSALPAAAATTQRASGTDGCESRALPLIPSYLKQQGLPNDTDVYAACSNGVAAVWVADEKGNPIEPLTDEAQDENHDDRAQARDVTDNTCVILDEYSVECNWGTTYKKMDGETGTVLWTRSLSSYALMNLQAVSHSVKLRYTHDQGIGHDSMGNVILQRQQGWLPPTYENDTDFYFPGGTQSTGTIWVNRADLSAGKYSMIFNLETVFDQAENVHIPILGDPTSPRFQCYSDSPEDFWKNCEYPNGEEAPVF